MSKHFYVIQSKERSEQNVNSSVVEKIYKIIDKDNRFGNFIDNTSEFTGKINTGYTYKLYIDTINEKFPSDTYLEIINSGLYVLFADKKVEQILIDNFSDLPGILETIQLDAGFNKKFTGNTEIETFDELVQLINIKKIEQDAFHGCTNLKSIDLSNITYLGYFAFYGCTSLAIDVNCPNLINITGNTFRDSGVISASNLGNITTLGSGVFWGCKSLTSVNLNGINEVGPSTFNGCTNLTTIENTDGLLRLKNETFQNCTSLESFPFNENITEIGSTVFNGCTTLTIENLNLPNLSILGNGAFKQTRIKKVTSLGSVVSIPTNCFNSCSLLTDISLSNITSIGESAFNGCTNLIINDLSLPNLVSVGIYAFANTGVKKLSNLGNITSIPNGLFNKCTLLTQVDLTNITNIGGYVYEKCTSLQTVNNTSSLTSIGQYCFDGCTNLTSIDTSNITILNRGVFHNCGSLQELDLHNVTYIAREAVQYCDNVRIKNGDLKKVTYIGYMAFENYGKNYSTPSSPAYLDLGANLIAVEAGFTRAKTNLIIRWDEIPENAACSFGTPWWAEGFYIYVKDELVDACKTKFTSDTSRFKPISELPIEWQ